MNMLESTVALDPSIPNLTDPTIAHASVVHEENRKQYPSNLSEVAISYAKRGWPVFPLHTPTGDGCTCRKGVDCSSPGKHPRTVNGFKDATVDQQQIARWWKEWPDANIGILTGVESGLIVIDVDDHASISGSQSLAEMEESIGETLDSLTALTGHGRHIYFRHPGGKIPSSAGTLMTGIDVRADGAYAVAPPSLHSSGVQYKWANEAQELNDLPEALIRVMQSEKTLADGLEFDNGELLYEGGRNTRLFKIGCALRGQSNMEEDEIASRLMEINYRRCHPPLDEAEVLSIAASICRYPAEQESKVFVDDWQSNVLPWFQFNTLDWFSNPNITVMNDKQIGHYISLKAYAWNRGGYLPYDMNQLWRLARATSKSAFEKGAPLVLAEYECVVVRGQQLLKNPRLAAEYEDKYTKWKKKQKAGQISAAAKRDRRPEAA